MIKRKKNPKKNTLENTKRLIDALKSMALSLENKVDLYRITKDPVLASNLESESLYVNRQFASSMMMIINGVAGNTEEY